LNLHRVLKSKCPEFPEGSQVVGGFGWRDLTVYKPVPGGVRTYNTIHKIPDMKGLPDSYALGAVGMPGFVKIIVIIGKLDKSSY